MKSLLSEETRHLERKADGRPAALVRIVHLGLGGFFRAHQAWYTDHAPDAEGWGIAAFTGRTAHAAEVLEAQDGLYTLLVRGAEASRPEVVSSLSAVHPGDDVAALRRYFSSRDVAVVTMTVTEAGYRHTASGGLDSSDPDVVRDVAALTGSPDSVEVLTTPGRLVAGLLARRDADAGPIAVVPCDNVSGNGDMVRTVVRDLSALVDPTLVDWVDQHVAFVTTMVDRITPRTTDADTAEVADLTGVTDAAVVVTEPYTEWVLSGAFPAGRPAWDEAGARFVDDVGPFENRKLWLLNGAHSLMAYAGPLLGHQTVADAVADPEVFAWVEEWWDDASAYLTLPAEEIRQYRLALFERFSNPNIRHLLEQIAADGSQKVRIRAVPVLVAARADGRLPVGAARLVAAWVASLRGDGASISDAEADTVVPLAAGPSAEAAANILAWLGIDDIEVTAVVAQLVDELEGRRTN